jgi:transposase-like protein
MSSVAIFFRLRDHGVSSNIPTLKVSRGLIFDTTTIHNINKYLNKQFNLKFAHYSGTSLRPHPARNSACIPGLDLF